MRFLTNLDKKVKSYEAEHTRLKSRVQVIDENYLEKLEKEVKIKQTKLEELTQQQLALQKDAKEKDLESMFTKEIETQNDIKKYYLKKIEIVNEVIEKNEEKIRIHRERCKELAITLEEFRKKTQGIHIQSSGSEKSIVKEILRANKGLKKRYYSYRVERNKDIFGLKSKKKFLVKELFKVKKQERSLKDLFRDISFVFPRNLSDYSLHSKIISRKTPTSSPIKHHYPKLFNNPNP